MCWRIGSAYHERPRDRNKAALHRIVKRGPPPGLLAKERRSTRHQGLSLVDGWPASTVPDFGASALYASSAQGSRR